MQNTNLPQGQIMIRPIRNDDAEIRAVAEMQCRAYRRQFYDPSGPLNGALGREFPVLDQYETLDSFISTWRKLAKMVTSPNPSGYAYVAFQAKEGRDGIIVIKPVGIAKSMSWQAGDDLCENLTVYGKAQRVQDVAELGSVYVDVGLQDKGIGALLVAEVAQAALDKGYKQMVTRAYARNISPKFFVEKAYGQIMGDCQIPYGYDLNLLQAKGLVNTEMPTSIPGTWIYWPTRNMIRIAQKVLKNADSLCYNSANRTLQASLKTAQGLTL